MDLPPSFWRLIGTYDLLQKASVIVLAGLVLWLLVAIARNAPASVALRLYGSAALWIGSPAVLGWAISAAGLYDFDLIGLGLRLYTVVYAALLIGNRLPLVMVRSDRTSTPDILSMRLPAFMVAIPVAIIVLAYINYGLGVPPGQWPAMTFYALVTLAVVAAGYFLTADQVARINAVLSIDHSRSQASSVQKPALPSPATSPANIRHADDEAPPKPPLQTSDVEASAVTVTEPNVQATSEGTLTTSTDETDAGTSSLPALEPQNATLPVPVPDIPESAAPQGIVLKLKRSQRSGFTGKVIFVLDARIQLTDEESVLVSRYRLGDDVIYESSARKERQAATQAHLDIAGSKTSQSAGKTFYRLARAGISATAAALSLRITINSLRSGVHVECKSMIELMEAETAIVKAASNVRDYLDLAETFDGREEILEF